MPTTTRGRASRSDDGTAPRARRALADPLVARGVTVDGDYRTDTLNDNLAARLAPCAGAHVRGAFAAGAGGELKSVAGRRPKMHSAYSSAALAVSAFAPFIEAPWALSLAEIRCFDRVEFEARLPTGVRGTPPHLDLLAHHARGRVAVESKCTEYLDPKPARFSDAYRRLAQGMHPSWRAVYADLLREPECFKPLDAAQLVKHYWGLSNTRCRGSDVLLYVYWEPLDAGAHPAFAEHRRAVEAFAQRVDDPRCRFCALSYCALWQRWSRIPGLAGHVDSLLARYGVPIAETPGVPD